MNSPLARTPEDFFYVDFTSVLQLLLVVAGEAYLLFFGAGMRICSSDCCYVQDGEKQDVRELFYEKGNKRLRRCI